MLEYKVMQVLVDYMTISVIGAIRILIGVKLRLSTLFSLFKTIIRPNYYSTYSICLIY